jgi:hypothetical protein
MKSIKTIILLLIFPIILFGQNDIDTKKGLDEVDNYVKQIDETCKDLKEGIVEGPIEYTKPKRKNGGWEAYYINDLQTKDLPLRIRYGKAEFDKNTDLNLYYRNGKLVFADLTITFTSSKRSNKTPYKRQFRFPEGRLQWETRTMDKEFNEAEKKYSFEYLFSEESLIRKMVYR